MAATIFWFIVIGALVCTVGFMACALFEYFSNNLITRIGASNLKGFLIKLDVVFFILIILLWII